jgi:hypothetical protein
MVPATAGAQWAVRVTLRPAASVSGVRKLLSLKPAPLTLILEIVTLEVPEFVNVTVSWLLLPTVTIPNSRLLRLGFNVELAATFQGRPRIASIMAAATRNERLELALGGLLPVEPKLTLKTRSKRGPKFFISIGV